MNIQPALNLLDEIINGASSFPLTDAFSMAIELAIQRPQETHEIESYYTDMLFPVMFKNNCFGSVQEKDRQLLAHKFSFYFFEKVIFRHFTQQIELPESYLPLIDKYWKYIEDSAIIPGYYSSNKNPHLYFTAVTQSLLFQNEKVFNHILSHMITPIFTKEQFFKNIADIQRSYLTHIQTQTGRKNIQSFHSDRVSFSIIEASCILWKKERLPVIFSGEHEYFFVTLITQLAQQHSDIISKNVFSTQFKNKEENYAFYGFINQAFTQQPYHIIQTILDIFDINLVRYLSRKTFNEEFTGDSQYLLASIWLTNADTDFNLRQDDRNIQFFFPSASNNQRFEQNSKFRAQLSHIFLNELAHIFTKRLYQDFILCAYRADLFISCFSHLDKTLLLESIKIITSNKDNIHTEIKEYKKKQSFEDTSLFLTISPLIFALNENPLILYHVLSLHNIHEFLLKHKKRTILPENITDCHNDSLQLMQEILLCLDYLPLDENNILFKPVFRNLPAKLSYRSSKQAFDIPKKDQNRFIYLNEEWKLKSQKLLSYFLFSENISEYSKKQNDSHKKQKI